MQLKFRHAIAAAAGVSVDKVHVMSIEGRSGRRMLAAAIVINLRISANDAAQAAQIATDLKIENINRELAKHGLKLSTVTQAPTAVHVESPSSNSDLLESSNSTGWWDTLVRNPSAFYMPEGEYFIYAVSAAGGLLLLCCCCCGAVCARRRRKRESSAKDGGHDVEAEKGDLPVADGCTAENSDGSQKIDGDVDAADEVTRGLAFTDVPAEALNGETGAEADEGSDEQGEAAIGSHRSEVRDAGVDLDNAAQETEEAGAAAADLDVRAEAEIPSKNSHLWDAMDSEASSEKKADDDVDFEENNAQTPGGTENSASHAAPQQPPPSGNPFLTCLHLRWVYLAHHDLMLRLEMCGVIVLYMSSYIGYI